MRYLAPTITKVSRASHKLPEDAERWRMCCKDSCKRW